MSKNTSVVKYKRRPGSTLVVEQLKSHRGFIDGKVNLLKDSEVEKAWKKLTNKRVSATVLERLGMAHIMARNASPRRRKNCRH